MLQVVETQSVPAGIPPVLLQHSDHAVLSTTVLLLVMYSHLEQVTLITVQTVNPLLVLLVEVLGVVGAGVGSLQPVL